MPNILFTTIVTAYMQFTMKAIFFSLPKSMLH
jgi:hypothetical protein